MTVLPCPHCGKAPEQFPPYDVYRCNPCTKDGGWMHVKDWNKRAPVTVDISGVKAVFQFDWKFAWNVFVYAFHSVLTGHKSGVEMPSGRVYCLTEKTHC